ncbi:hypothetical protein AB0909_23685 [Streptomyces albidoflavus]|uniref:hypothetical protein n=1 Tax=Streptomyces albidoflavus TaxID=1886 RepID=UPI00211A9FFF|nr:hypothetical protein [Streptomyces albidoflavus]
MHGRVDHLDDGDLDLLAVEALEGDGVADLGDLLLVPSLFGLVGFLAGLRVVGGRGLVGGGGDLRVAGGEAEYSGEGCCGDGELAFHDSP